MKIKLISIGLVIAFVLSLMLYVFADPAQGYEDTLSTTYLGEASTDKGVYMNIYSGYKGQASSWNKIVSLAEDGLGEAPDYAAMTHDEFVEYVAPACLYIYQQTGVLPSLNIAQACMESGWGKNVIGYNFWGIKSKYGSIKEYVGKYTLGKTSCPYGICNPSEETSVMALEATGFELVNGTNVYSKMLWAFPTTYASGAQLRTDLINAYYKKVKDGKTPYEQLAALRAGGYFTADLAAYWSAINATIKANDLLSYDPGGSNFTGPEYGESEVAASVWY